MTPEGQLAGFIDKYTPEVAAEARAALGHLTARIPGATLLAYDNFNACAIGFSANDRAGGVVISLAIYPRWINLFFLKGIGLPDPDGLLRGAGKQVRHIRLKTAADIASPGIEALITAALAHAAPPIDPAARSGVIIKSVSPSQRPRRP